MTEFGVSLADERVEDEVAGDDVVTPDRDMPAVTTEDGIELKGFPWTYSSEITESSLYSIGTG